VKASLRQWRFRCFRAERAGNGDQAEGRIVATDEKMEMGLAFSVGPSIITFAVEPSSAGKGRKPYARF
jgi:hypothetical protein